MDIQKLITMGKMNKTVAIGEFTFELETPPSFSTMANTTDPIGLLAQFIVKINEDHYRTPEQKTALKEILNQVQSAITNELSKVCLKLGEEQAALVEKMSKNF